MIRKIALLSLVSIPAFGCSSSSQGDPFGPEPDMNSIQAEYDRPTGTFARGSEASIFSSYESQRGSGAIENFANVTAPPKSNGGLQSQGLRILSNDNDATFCAQLSKGQDAAGSCSCPSGGSLQFSIRGIDSIRASRTGPVDLVAKLRFEQCKAGDATIDGREFLIAKSNGTPSAEDLRMLLDAHLTASVGTVTAKVDLDAIYNNGKYWIFISVNDGRIVVATDSNWSESTKTGRIYIRDKNDAWTCDLVNGKGTCTSDHGETRQVE